MDKTSERELLRLVELDFDNTNKFIERTVGTGFTIRGWAITLSLALVGVAFDRHLWQLGPVAIVVILVFAFLDAYHLWLYSQALAHAQSIDRVLVSYYASLARGEDDQAAIDDFRDRLEAHTFGLTASLLRFQISSLRFTRTRPVLLVLYGILLAVAAAAGLLVAFVDKP